MSDPQARRRFGEGREQVQQRPNPGRGLVTVLDLAAASHFRAMALLLICCALFFLPGFFNVPPIDRDEALIAQTSRHMLETGDLLTIRNQNEIRSNSPVAIHWLQAATVEIVSRLGLPRAEVRIWIYRVPSLIAAVATVLLTYWAALAFVTRRAAVLAALMMCASMMLVIVAHVATPDAALALCAITAMGAMARTYLSWQRGEDAQRPSWTLPAIFWTAIAAGLMLRGPLILLFPLLTVVALAAIDRAAGWLLRLRPVLGLVWTLALLSPWLGALAWRGDPLFEAGFGQDMLNFLTGMTDMRRGPPGVHFALFWVLFWPGCVLAGLAAAAVWQARREPAAQFLLAWIVPSWIALELLVVRVPSFALPLYPAIAILTAGALEQRVLSRRIWLVRGVAWWFVMPMALTVFSVGAVIALTYQPAFLAWPFAAAAAIFGLFAWLLYDDNRAERSLLNALAASFFFVLTNYGILIPSMTPAFPSADIARALRNVECRQPRAAAAGFTEPSLIFMTSAATIVTDASGAADFLAQGSCRFALVEQRAERTFGQRAEAIGLRYAVQTRIEGYNYANGRQISVAIFRSEGTPPPPERGD